MKPDWDEAPEWAMFCAQDEDGGWWWYECHPDRKTCVWTAERVGGHVESARVYAPNWKESLQERP